MTTLQAQTLPDHELLRQVGPGTLMGQLLRRYWVPALLSEELPAPGGAPVRVRLLGEDLVAFRSPDGEVGLVSEFCAHRGASLFFGRNEEGGIRCSYHGWKYDTGGTCLDMPNEPATSSFKYRIRQPAYSVTEAGGLIWAYLGPADALPPLPDLEFLAVADAQRYVSKRLQDCHWGQALEVDIDSAHVPWLHGEIFLDSAPGSSLHAMLADTAPTFELLDKDFGMTIAARREHPDGAFWRVTHWIAPWFTVIPAGIPPVALHAWVPIDETHCWVYSLVWDPQQELTDAQVASWKSGEAFFAELAPSGYVPLRNKSNDWLVDRDAQRAGLLSAGVHGNQEQDDAIAASMGPYYDRTREHLVGTDAAVIAVRRWLAAAARVLASTGRHVPAGGCAYADPVTAVLPAGADWTAELAPAMWPARKHG